jgi:hypothetical protein
MSKRKHGLGLLGLLAVTALVVMAFASAAQAVTPQFAVNGAPASAALDAQFTGEAEGRTTLSIPALNFEINCEKGEITGGLIASSTDAKIEKLLYKECTVLEFKAPLAELPCHVSDVHTGNPASLHITLLNMLLLPVEFAAGHFGILDEKILTFLNFLSGTGCPLPLKSEIKGEICLLITSVTNDTTEPLTTTSETIQKSCPKRIVLEGLEPNPVGGTFEDKLSFGPQPMYITGSAKLKLIGAHAGLTLGVLLF